MKYILYCRKSSEDKGRQVLSLDSQVNEMKKLAGNLGLEVIKTFRESKSAKQPNNRPLFSEMIEFIEKNKKQSFGILCWKIDRLSRNPIDSATIQWLLQKEKIKAVQTSDRQYLPSDNVLLFNVESGMANQYILDLSKNVKRGIVAKLEKGGYPNLAPIGYVNDTVNKTIVIDKKPAKYIRKAFEMYASGNHSLNEISDTLYSEGFRSRSGCKIYKGRISIILANTIYYGVITKKGRKYIGNHEPIITKELFDKVEKVREEATRPRLKKLHFMYRGVLTCEKCGCMMTASLKKQKHTYYYCTNGKKKCDEHKSYLKEDIISKEMLKIFEQVKFDEEFIEKCYRAKKEKLGQDDNYYENIKKDLDERLRRIERRKNALLDLFIDGDVQKEVYDKKLENLENEKVEIMGELKSIKAKIGVEGEVTLERTKELFLAPITWSKCFLEYKDEKKEKVIKKLLWNATFENKKIASLNFKEPYNVLAKVEDKSDFLQMRGFVDNVRTKLRKSDTTIRIPTLEH